MTWTSRKFYRAGTHYFSNCERFTIFTQGGDNILAKIGNDGGREVIASGSITGLKALALEIDTYGSRTF
jgi:hypothetical protein